MAKKTKPPIDQDAIDAILIEELSTQDEQLVPTAKLIEDLGRIQKTSRISRYRGRR